MTTFSAADSALGYLYQVRVALLWSLRRARAGTNFVVSLETLDDVTFESLQATGPKPDELLQTKHHRKSEASLTDASGDLWKSLRVWFEGHANSTIPPGTALYLLTTGSAPKDGAVWYLRSDGARDVEKALQKLETVTQTSESEANAPEYKAFSAGVHPDRESLPRRRCRDCAGRLGRASARGRARRAPCRAGLGSPLGTDGS